MPKRIRDYKAEYARRIAGGRAKGLSRAQARGHPRPREKLASSPVAERGTYSRRLELGFKAIERGKTLTASAKQIHVSPERLRRYLTEQRVAEKHGRKWVPRSDHRVRQMLLYTRGRARSVQVNRAQASDVGTYFSAVARFLAENDPLILLPYEDRGVTDIRGAFHPFEIDPNTLYRLSNTGRESFEQVYRIVR